MRMASFGDSYDPVKRSLMGWLSPDELWMVHPMFTDSISLADLTRSPNSLARDW